jgi:hypothetical protein
MVDGNDFILQTIVIDTEVMSPVLKVYRPILCLFRLFAYPIIVSTNTKLFIFP